MKILFFGTPIFSRDIVQGLSSHHDIVGVVTQPDRPRGRGHRLVPSPVKQWALSRHIRVFTPTSLKEKDFLAQISSLEADVFVVAAFGMLFPPVMLDMAPRGSLNIHTSLLPKHRGASPVESAILSGDLISGVTLMQMDEGLDTGDIFFMEELSLDHMPTPLVLESMVPIALRLLHRLFCAWERGEVVVASQQTGSPSYSRKIDKSSHRIHWEETALVLERKIRAYYPDAFTQWGKERLKILQASVAAESSLPPGTVSNTNDKGIYVTTGEGDLSIEILQRSGKRALSAAEFLRGNNIPRGTVLGG